MGPATLQTCLKIHIALVEQPAHLEIGHNVSFNLSEWDQEPTCFWTVSKEAWLVNGYWTSRICLNCPCSCLLKCILLLKNKRHHLYSLTKVLKKWTFWSLSRYSEIDPITTNFSVLCTNIYRVTGGGDLTKIKGAASFEAESVLQIHTEEYTLKFISTSMWVFTQTEDISKIPFKSNFQPKL